MESKEDFIFETIYYIKKFIFCLVYIRAVHCQIEATFLWQKFCLILSSILPPLILSFRLYAFFFTIPVDSYTQSVI